MRVVPADDPVNALVEKTLDLKQQALAITERLAASRREELSILRPTNQATGPKLAEALDAYLVNVQTKKREMDGTVSDFGGLVGRRIKNMKEHLADKDITLDKVNIKFLDEWLTCWENRPTGKRGGPVSKLWAEGIIATIRAFVRWLNMSDDFAWEKLRQYEVTPITVKDTEEELARTPSRNRYKRSELPALYEYASPRERVFILLALNCGFGEGEISTLARNEIVFGDEKSYIKRRRRKTKVFTQWLLWPETVEALKWYLAKVRPKSDSLYVFISEKGRPIKERTKGNNRSQYIANGWERVYKRIVKDRPDFFKLSFNKLRKTGSNWIRMKYEKELADLYLGHGKKEVVDAYTEKKFGPMFQATRHYRKVIGPMFQAVPVPFPEDARKSNPSLSRAKMKKLQERRDQGYTIKKIAEVEQVSPQTVMRYTTKPTKAK